MNLPDNVTAKQIDNCFASDSEMLTRNEAFANLEVLDFCREDFIHVLVKYGRLFGKSKAEMREASGYIDDMMGDLFGAEYRAAKELV